MLGEDFVYLMKIYIDVTHDFHPAIDLAICTNNYHNKLDAYPNPNDLQFKELMQCRDEMDRLDEAVEYEENFDSKYINYFKAFNDKEYETTKHCLSFQYYRFLMFKKSKLKYKMLFNSNHIMSTAILINNNRIRDDENKENRTEIIYIDF